MSFESFEENHQRNPDWLSEQLDALLEFTRNIDPKADLDQLTKDLEKLNFRISSAVAQANAQTAQLHHEVQEIERAIDIEINNQFDGIGMTWPPSSIARKLESRYNVSGLLLVVCRSF